MPRRICPGSVSAGPEKTRTLAQCDTPAAPLRVASWPPRSPQCTRRPPSTTPTPYLAAWLVWSLCTFFTATLATILPFQPTLAISARGPLYCSPSLFPLLLLKPCLVSIPPPTFVFIRSLFLSFSSSFCACPRWIVCAL